MTSLGSRKTLQIEVASCLSITLAKENLAGSAKTADSPAGHPGCCPHLLSWVQKFTMRKDACDCACGGTSFKSTESQRAGKDIASLALKEELPHSPSSSNQ